MFLGEPEHLACNKTNNGTDDHREKNLVQHNVIEPALLGWVLITTLSPFANGATDIVDWVVGAMNQDEVKRHEQERESKAVVGTGFSNNNVANRQRDIFLSEAPCPLAVYQKLHSPLQIELASTGSVGVTHEPIASDSRYVSPGMRAQMKRAVINHAAVMTGSSRVVRLMRSRQRYAFGREIPVNRT